MAAFKIAFLFLVATTSPSSAAQQGICGYHFPLEHPNANVIIRNEDPLALAGLTLNYFVYIESFTHTSYPLSSMLHMMGGSTATSTMIEPLETDYDIPLETNKWLQITYTWTSTDGRYNLYVNGHLKTLGFTNAGETIVDTDNGFMVLGQKINATGEPCADELSFFTDKRFIGYIAHFQMWDVVLSGDVLFNVLHNGTDLSSVPNDQLFVEPFEIKDGAASYWTDCPMCPEDAPGPYPDTCNDASWGYVAWDMNENEQQVWTAACARADLPSPIDVSLPDLLEGYITTMDTSSCGQVQTTNYKLENDQHTVMITLTEQDSLQSTVCFYDKFNLTLNIAKIWFHWPSEHMIDGDRVPLEMKLYMKDTSTGFIYVASVLFRLGSTADPFIENVIPALQMARTPVKHDFGTAGLPQLNFNLLRELLDSHNHYYKYVGAGTFPPCEENIHYIIFDSRYTKVTADQMAEFHCITRCQLDPNIYRQNAYMFGNYRAVKTSSAQVTYHNLNP